MTHSHPLASDLDDVLAETRGLWNEIRGERIFITGATGFFGCWLLETFTWANHRLDLKANATILTRDPRKLKRLVPHLNSGRLEVIVGDVRSFSFPLGTFSHVIHAATESSSDLNAKQPQLMFDTIVGGTQRCLDFAVKVSAMKFLLTSSGAVYGKQPSDLTHVPEDFTGGPDPLDPHSAYAEGKRAAELLCTLAAKNSRLEVKIARCFAFVGPYMKLDAHFAIGNFIRDYLEETPIEVRGDGTPVRSYMYASDLMVWLWSILFNGQSCRPYNVGSEAEISIAELARVVAGFGPGSKPVQMLQRPAAGAPERYVPNTTRARQELGLTCSVPLHAAVKRTVEWNLRGAHKRVPLIGMAR
jgi:nucleoside-diphosphate-sugar epimerase